ncbi:MAG: bifunctional oligoribonuclease/PAP phosphatase NrnA [Ignavibacteriaceae bacterium]
MENFRILKDIFFNNSSFLLTTHVNPDADAIGSELAVYQILKSLGKRAVILNHSETPYNLKFLDTDNVIRKFNEDEHSLYFNESDVFIALDFNRSDRLVSMETLFNKSDKLKVVIDHHLDEDIKANYKFIDTRYSATGEIIYDFIKQTNIIKPDYKIALPIYAAIMTDTGSFRFERTTSRLHRFVAELLELGVNPSEIYDQIYDQSNFSRIRLLGEALTSLQLTGNGKSIAYMVVKQEQFKRLGAFESDTDNFVNFCLSVKGVKIGLLFIELKDGFKVSFRSKGNIPVNKIAQEFGGGGHLNAAGARFRNEKLDQHIGKILSFAEKYI